MPVGREGQTAEKRRVGEPGSPFLGCMRSAVLFPCPSGHAHLLYARGMESDRHHFKTLLCHLLVLLLCSRSWTSLGLSVFICRERLAVPLLQGHKVIQMTEPKTWCFVFIVSFKDILGSPKLHLTWAVIHLKIFDKMGC